MKIITLTKGYSHCYKNCEIGCYLHCPVYYFCLGTVLKTVGNRLVSMGVDTRVDKEKTVVDQFDKNLQSLGVQIKNSSSEYKDLYLVFLELSRRWNG